MGHDEALRQLLPAGLDRPVERLASGTRVQPYGVMEDLRELGLRPGINTLFDVTKAAPSMSSHTITFEVIPGLVDRAAGVLAGIADAGGRVMIALDGAQQKGID